MEAVAVVIALVAAGAELAGSQAFVDTANDAVRPTGATRLEIGNRTAVRGDAGPGDGAAGPGEDDRSE
jgi:hypothetical protein